jgi:hypothetical protein
MVLGTGISTIHDEMQFSRPFSIPQTPDFDIGVLHEMEDLG